MLLRLPIRKSFMLVGLAIFAAWLILPPSFGNGKVRFGRQNAAIQTLKKIRKRQAEYRKIHNRFGTLKELAGAGLIEDRYDNEQIVYAYIYSEVGVSADTYCVQATRSNRRTAYKDFIVCEDGIIRYHESGTPQQLNRGEGESISEVEAAPSPTPTP